IEIILAVITEDSLRIGFLHIAHQILNPVAAYTFFGVLIFESSIRSMQARASGAKWDVRKAVIKGGIVGNLAALVDPVWTLRIVVFAITASRTSSRFACGDLSVIISLWPS